MLAHIVHRTLRNPELTHFDEYLKWWFGRITPIVCFDVYETILS